MQIDVENATSTALSAGAILSCGVLFGNRCGPPQRHGTDSPEIRICFSAGTGVAKLFSKAPSDWKSRGQTTSAPVLRLTPLHIT
jgi:hypothetical protein